MFTLEKARELAGVPGPCLTIIHPLGLSPAPVQSAHSKFLSAIPLAKAALAEADAAPEVTDRIVSQVRKLAESAELFNRAGSLLIFSAPGFQRTAFWPELLPQLVKAGPSFYILPLLPKLTARTDYWLLALSINHVRLYHGSEGILEAVELPASLPTNLQDAGGFDAPDHDLENRAPSGSALGQMRRVRFGTASLHEVKNQHLINFFKMIDREIQPILARRPDPLILAAVGHHISHYRQINTYPRLLEQGIHGSADALSEQSLPVRAEQILETYLLTEALNKARQAMEASSDRLLTENLHEILAAAEQGSVRCLRLGPVPHGSEDLLNSCVMEVLGHSGTLAVPQHEEDAGPTTAILRFATASRS